MSWNPIIVLNNDCRSHHDHVNQTKQVTQKRLTIDLAAIDESLEIC